MANVVPELAKMPLLKTYFAADANVQRTGRKILACTENV